MLLILLLVALCIVVIIYFRGAARRTQRRISMRYSDDVAVRLRISVVVAGASSVEYVASLLRSDSTAYQVVVVVDFERKPKLLRELIDYFGLFKVVYRSPCELRDAAPRALYRSFRRLYSKLLIVDAPTSDYCTPFQVGAQVSSYDYNLQLTAPSMLRSGAIENLLLELSLHDEGSVAQIRSALLEPVRLLGREASLFGAKKQPRVGGQKILRINYKLLI